MAQFKPIRPDDMVKKLTAACKGCAAQTLPTFKPNQPALPSGRDRYFAQQQVYRKKDGFGQIIDMNKDLQDCLNQQLRNQHHIIDLKRQIQRLEQDYTVKQSSHEKQLIRLRNMHMREIMTLEETSRIEESRVLQQRALAQRQEQQAWLQIQRVRRAIKQKSSQNSMLIQEVQQLSNRIRTIGRENQGLIERIGRMGTYKSYFQPRLRPCCP